MSRTERASHLLLLALVACLPFEIRSGPAYPSELQVFFVGLLLLSLPMLVRERRTLLSNRLVIAALLFAGTAWIAALTSPDVANALKGAGRYTVGVLLLCIALRTKKTNQIREVWAIAAVVSAVYGLADHYGFGFPRLFRTMEYYYEDVTRLSGSFEYPNVAAAYFAMSLPIVWTAAWKRPYRIAASILLWIVLILTFSRGAVVAVVAVALLWALLQRSYWPAGFVATGIVLYASLAIYHPVLVERVARMEPRKVRKVEFRPLYTLIQEKPGVVSEMPLRLINAGREIWPSRGDSRVTIFNHWYNTVTKEIVDMPLVETVLPHDIKPDESVTVISRFQTPDAEGFYLLDWDLRYPPNNSFAITDASLPGVVEVKIRRNMDPLRSNTDVSHWYKRTHGPQVAADIPRTQLWRAAGLIVARHPLFGIGPDNYRLTYGEVLGFADWDRHIRSNNLYLEILVGGGVIGLLAFLFLIYQVPWHQSPALYAVGVALFHGFVDFFLMTTPIYFGFWILMGTGAAERRGLKPAAYKASRS